MKRIESKIAVLLSVANAILEAFVSFPGGARLVVQLLKLEAGLTLYNQQRIAPGQRARLQSVSSSPLDGERPR